MSTNQYTLPQGAELSAELLRARLRYVTVSQYSEEWNSTLHTHTCAELFFILRGRGHVLVQQDRVAVEAGDLVVVNTGVLHTETSGGENPMEYIVLGVDGLEIVAGVSGYLLLHLQAEREELTSHLRMLQQEARNGLPGCGTVCQNLLEIMLVRLTRREDVTLSAAPTGSRSSRECELVRRYIDSHFKENLSLEQLADLAHINKYYLAHVFKREYGVSPINYLISQRIQESKNLLEGTNHSLSQISHMLGFSSPSYFSQSFRRIEGVSPMEFRRSCRNGEEE